MEPTINFKHDFSVFSWVGRIHCHFLVTSLYEICVILNTTGEVTLTPDTPIDQCV